MSWELSYQEDLTSPSALLGPVDVPLTGSQLAIIANSLDVPDGPENLRLILLLTFTGETFSPLELPIAQRPTINRKTLVSIPSVAADSRLLRVEIPPWYTSLSLEIWQRETPSPTSGNTPTREVLIVQNEGQTVFTLSSIPSIPMLTELYINGIRATYSTEFLIDNAILTWIASLTLSTTDEVEVIYQ